VQISRAGSLIFQGKSDSVRPWDLLVGLILFLLVVIPFQALSWLAVAVVSLYILIFTDASLHVKRGAVVLLTVTLPMLWTNVLLHFFANFILEIDAVLISWLLGTGRHGNMVRFLDGSGYLVIFPACSSIANTALAFVCWVTLSQLVGARWRVEDAAWCGLASASVITVNISRLGIMGLSEWHYQQLHGQLGDVIANVLMLGFVVSFCILGLRRELRDRV
jgi:hypothetical protein